MSKPTMDDLAALAGRTIDNLRKVFDADSVAEKNRAIREARDAFEIVMAMGSEAADEIERLRRQADALAGALAGLIPTNLGYNSAVPDAAVIPVDVALGEIRIARSALAAYRKGEG